MNLSISHVVADFIEYITRLLQRLKVDGNQLSAVERRILSVQFRQLSNAIKALDEIKLKNRTKETV
jgi:hypothetical protein